MTTIRKSATVEVMISQSYNHFKTTITLENDKGIKTEEINEARRECQGLCNEAKDEYLKKWHEDREKRKASVKS